MQGAVADSLQGIVPRQHPADKPHSQDADIPAAAPLRPPLASGSAATNDALVLAIAEKIRSLQRRRQDTRIRWHAHCVSHFGGVKDPAWHTIASLSQLLASEIQFLVEDDGADDEDYSFIYKWLRDVGTYI